MRVYAISDQDDTGPWIRNTFQDLFYIVSPGYEHNGAGGYHFAAWTGISGDNFHGRFSGGNTKITGQEWIKQNIQTNHGELGEKYPDVAYLMEGDSPSFLYMINNGQNNPERPDYGGWGGRYELYTPRLRRWFFEPERRPIWTDTEDDVISDADAQFYASNQATIWRWREAFQNDFAARMDWCVKSFREANHPPFPQLSHMDRLTIKSGESLELDASLSKDPDNNMLQFKRYQYREAGTSNARVKIDNPDSPRISIVIPKVETTQTIHIILEVIDGGVPSLTRYRRVILDVSP